MWNSLVSWISGYDSANGQAAANADATLTSMNAVDYAPGGSIYNRIAASDGTAAADAAYTKFQNDYLAQGIISVQSQQADIAAAAAAGAADGATNVATLLTDLVIAAVIGFIGWAFFSAGGFGWLEGESKKQGKTVFIVAALAILAYVYFAYLQITKLFADLKSFKLW